MKTSAIVSILACVVTVQGFTPLLSSSKSAATITTTSTQLFAYIPDGFTPESYKKFKAAEAAKKKKNLGQLGPKGFQSRSFQSFQEAMERGEATHLMPMFNAKDKIKRGEIRAEDVPVSYSIIATTEEARRLCRRLLTAAYRRSLTVFLFILLGSSSSQYMQRGGKWDNTDVSGAKNKKKWSSSDKKYAKGGFLKEQSVSVLGMGSGLDWTGSQGRTGPSETVPGAAPKFGRNYKAPKVQDLKKAPPKKGGFFGLF
jgi:hypothetical protein